MNVRLGANASGHAKARRENGGHPAEFGDDLPSASLSQTKPGRVRAAIFPGKRSSVPCLRALRVLPGKSAWAERSFFPERFRSLWRSLRLGRRYADRERSGPP